MPRDPYDALGVPKTATADEIQKAYRKLSMKHHPDRNPGDKQADATYKEVQAAYEVLSDPQKKANFDRWGFAGPPGAGGFPGGGFPGGGGPDFRPRSAPQAVRRRGRGRGCRSIRRAVRPSSRSRSAR